MPTLIKTRGFSFQLQASLYQKNDISVTPSEVLLRNGVGKTCPWKNIFCSMNVYKSRGEGIFEIIYWPFELPPN